MSSTVLFSTLTITLSFYNNMIHLYYNLSSDRDPFPYPYMYISSSGTESLQVLSKHSGEKTDCSEVVADFSSNL